MDSNTGFSLVEILQSCDLIGRYWRATVCHKNPVQASKAPNMLALLWPLWHKGRISSTLIGRAPTLLRSHWSNGPLIGALSVATPAILCHKEPARRKNSPY